jgi:hypothetical protein
MDSVGVDYQEFKSSGTWEKPDGISLVLVEALAGGEGGGAGDDSNSGTIPGDGGDGGDYAIGLIVASQLSATENVEVGAGGNGKTTIGSNSSTPGGSSKFGDVVNNYLVAAGDGESDEQSIFYNDGVIGYTSDSTQPDGGGFRGAGGGAGEGPNYGPTNGVTTEFGTGGDGGEQNLSEGEDGTDGTGFGSGGGGGSLVGYKGKGLGGDGTGGFVRVWSW